MRPQLERYSLIFGRGIRTPPRQQVFPTHLCATKAPATAHGFIAGLRLPSVLKLGLTSIQSGYYLELKCSSPHLVAPTSALHEPQLGLALNRAHQGSHLTSDKRICLKASLSYHLLAVAIISFIGILAQITLQGSSQTESSDDLSDSHSPAVMASQIPEGRPGNLTPEQEEKLRQLWISILQLCGVAESNEASSADASTPLEPGAASEGEASKKKRFGMFRKNRGENKSSTTLPLAGDAKNGEDDDKYGQTKQFHETLAKNSPETIRSTIWAMVKHDHPDALLLRFLRARKWDVEKALVMAVSTLNWRHNEMLVDAEIMRDGEAGALENLNDEDAHTQKLGEDFLAQIRMGKSFLHGTDKNGRPICVIRVRLHKQGEQCEESLEKYTVYIIETTRMILSPPVDTAVSAFLPPSFFLLFSVSIA